MHQTATTLPAEPLINHDVPQGPGKRSINGSMEWDNKRYLLIIDYLSKYYLLYQIASITMTAVIACVKELLALQGMLLEIFRQQRSFKL